MNTKENQIPYFEDAESALKPNLPAVERDAINAIIYNPVTDKVICLDWVKFGWKTFIIGGIEVGESPVSAAFREILEETGYRNLRFVADLGKTRSGYYAAHKGENRISNATGLLFELASAEQGELEHPENLPHVFRWVSREDVSGYLTLSSQKYIWEKAQVYLTKA